MREGEVRKMSRLRKKVGQLGRNVCLYWGETGRREDAVHLHLIHAVVPSSHRLPQCSQTVWACVSCGRGSLCVNGFVLECESWCVIWTWLYAFVLRSECMIMSNNALYVCCVSRSRQRLFLKQSKRTFVKIGRAEGCLTGNPADAALQHSAVFLHLTFTSLHFFFLAFFQCCVDRFNMRPLSGPHSAIYIK